MQWDRYQHALAKITHRRHEDRPPREMRIKLSIRNMLVLETKAVELEGRRAAILEARDHGLAAAGIAAHCIDGDRIILRQQAGIDQRPQQRDRTGWIAARIGDFPFRPYLVGLVGLQLRKTVSPVGRDAKG